MTPRISFWRHFSVLTHVRRLLLQEDPALTRNWKKTVHIAVTGASGQISNHLLFMLASGENVCEEG
jgi:hypothetical protein